MPDDTPLSSPLAGGSTANTLAPSYGERAKAMLTGSGPIHTSKGVTFTPEDIDRAIGMGMSFSGGGLATKPISAKAMADIGEKIFPMLRQPGEGMNYISDIIKQTGLSKEQVHQWILDRVKSGQITIHPST